MVHPTGLLSLHAMMKNTFCLGSQYWSAQAASQGYRARYGILLDMVGGRDNQFYFEGFSIKYAQSAAVRLWDAARYAGAENYFISEMGGMITDDHVPMNTIAGIPTIDVIGYTPLPLVSLPIGTPPTHHGQTLSGHTTCCGAEFAATPFTREIILRKLSSSLPYSLFLTFSLYSYSHTT